MFKSEYILERNENRLIEDYSKSLHLERKLAKLSFIGIGVVIILTLTFGFYINTKLLEIKKNESKVHILNQHNILLLHLKNHLHLLNDVNNRDDIYHVNLFFKRIKEFKSTNKALGNYHSKNIDKLLKFGRQIEQLTHELVIQYTQYQIFNEAKIDSTISDFITYESYYSPISQLELGVSLKRNERTLLSIIWIISLYLFLLITFLIVSFFIIFYPTILDMDFILKKIMSIQKNNVKRNQKIFAFIDRISEEKPHKLTKEEVNTAIIESREEERRQLAFFLEHLREMLKNTEKKTYHIDYSNLSVLQKYIKRVISDINNISNEIQRLEYNLLPSTIINRGLIPSLILLIKHTSLTSSIQLKFENKTFFNKRFNHLYEVTLYRLVEDVLEILIINNENKIRKCLVSLSHNDWHLQITFSMQGAFYKKNQMNKQIQDLPEKYRFIFKRAELINVSIIHYTYVGNIFDIELIFPIN